MAKFPKADGARGMCPRALAPALRSVGATENEIDALSPELLCLITQGGRKVWNERTKEHHSLKEVTKKYRFARERYKELIGL